MSFPNIAKMLIRSAQSGVRVTGRQIRLTHLHAFTSASSTLERPALIFDSIQSVRDHLDLYDAETVLKKLKNQLPLIIDGNINNLLSLLNKFPSTLHSQLFTHLNISGELWPIIYNGLAAPHNLSKILSILTSPNQDFLFNILFKEHQEYCRIYYTQLLLLDPALFIKILEPLSNARTLFLKMLDESAFVAIRAPHINTPHFRKSVTQLLDKDGQEIFIKHIRGSSLAPSQQLSSTEDVISDVSVTTSLSMKS